MRRTLPILTGPRERGAAGGRCIPPGGGRRGPYPPSRSAARSAVGSGTGLPQEPTRSRTSGLSGRIAPGGSVTQLHSLTVNRPRSVVTVVERPIPTVEQDGSRRRTAAEAARHRHAARAIGHPRPLPASWRVLRKHAEDVRQEVRCIGGGQALPDTLYDDTAAGDPHSGRLLAAAALWLLARMRRDRDRAVLGADLDGRAAPRARFVIPPQNRPAAGPARPNRPESQVGPRSWSGRAGFGSAGWLRNALRPRSPAPPPVRAPAPRPPP